MKLFLYRGSDPNFGDELNDHLWDRLLPDFFDGHDDPRFLGIGSILFDDHPQDVKKLVFGSGYGGYTRPPVLDQNWDVFFVRGPRTAAALKLDPKLAVGDAAILLRALPAPISRRPTGRSPVAFIPHWESVLDGHWQAAAEAAGLYFIDPRRPVETVLGEISASTLVVAEAMHGAIVADALRVPWVAFEPLPVHRFKWSDWAEALDMQVDFAPSAPTTWLEQAIRQIQPGPTMQRRLRHYGRPHRELGAGIWNGRAAEALRRAALRPGNLSDDRAIERATTAMQDHLRCLQHRYALHANRAPKHSLMTEPSLERMEQ